MQSNSRTFRNLASQSRQRRVYHQCAALYITNTKCCISSLRKQIQPVADEIQGRLADLDDIRMYISPQANYTFNDMPLLSQWIKKFDKSKLVEFFWQGRKDSNPRPMVLETSTLPTELHPFATTILYNKKKHLSIDFQNIIDEFIILCYNKKNENMR